MFEAVIVDYGEVLCSPPTPAHVARMANLIGVSLDQFRKLYDRNRRAYDRADLTPERYWFSFADEPGVRVDAKQIELLRAWDVDMWSAINPTMIEWVSELRKSGYRTAVLSNMHADMAAKVRAENGWIRNFRYTVLSCELQLAKPEAAVYRYCLEKLGSNPENTLFIDDREINIRAAQALGIHAIRFESVAQLESELKRLHFLVLPALCATL